MLLHADVDPTIRNISGSQAVELLPKGETRSLEHLRMAMYSGKLVCYVSERLVKVTYKG